MQHRLRGEYAEAQRSLMRAIELAHDCGEAHHELGLVYLARGRVEDAVDCFHLAIHFGPQLAAPYASLGAALLALRQYDAAEAACRQALALDSASVSVWLRLGSVLKARGELAQAAAACRTALEHDGGNREAACQLAFVLFKLGQYEESGRTYATLLSREPDYAQAHHNFGLLLLETGCPAEALQRFERALALKPGMIETRTCVAHALRDLGRLDDAVAAYDAALAQQPDFGDARLNRGYALLMRGDYAAGWPEYEQRFAEMPQPDFTFPTWRGESLSGKRILVFAEQGIGDEIMFASCLPDVLEVAGNGVVECNKRLAGLFERSFPRARVHGANKEDDTSWTAGLPRVDYQVAIGSLPLHFRPSGAAFPKRRGYLQADPQRVAFWHRELAAPAKSGRVGIAWRGGIVGTRQFLRSTQVSDWSPIVGQPGLGFVSLQYGDCAAEIEELSASSGTIRDAGGAAADLDELAAVIAALDLVISVDNTVAHLAGALGKPVWVLLPFSAEWRYLRGTEGMPWYPSARLFRQPQPRDWTSVMVRVADALRTEFPSCSNA